MNWLAGTALALAFVCGIYSGYRAGWLRGRRVGWGAGLEAARTREREWKAMARERRRISGV